MVGIFPVRISRHARRLGRRYVFPPAVARPRQTRAEGAEAQGSASVSRSFRWKRAVEIVGTVHGGLPVLNTRRRSPSACARKAPGGFGSLLAGVLRVQGGSRG